MSPTAPFVRYHRFSPNRKNLLKLAAAAVIAMPAIAWSQTSGTWAADVGTAGGNWSDPNNWIGGIIPDNGGTASFVTLPTFTTAPINIIQDQPTVTLSNISFDSFITYLLRTPAGSPGNSITLAGPATINVVRPSINTLSITFFGHQIQMPLAGNAGLTKTGPGTVTLWSTNTFSGPVNLNGGIVVARQFGDAVFGDAANQINLNDGTIRVTTAAWNSSRTINLAGNGTFESGTTQGITFNGPVIGAGNLNKIGSNGLTITSNSTYTGSTNLLAGTMALAGNGALSNTSALTLRNQLSLIDNQAITSNNRVNDAAPVTFLGSGLSLTGNGSAASSETLGNVAFSRGTTTVTVTPGIGQTASLAFGNAARDTGGTAFFRGTGLGAAAASNVANISFATAPEVVGGSGAPGSTNISIIPWAFGSTNASSLPNTPTNSFVTYGPTGVRPLDTNTEYASSIPAGVSSDNVRITSAQTVNAPATVNSLLIAGSGGISGDGPLTITSGALLNLQSGVALGTPLNFGIREAIIHAPASIAFNGAISGSGGLSKQGAGVATFSAANTYTGTTTIGGGSAAFLNDVLVATPGPFGNSASAVVLAPAGLGTGGTTARMFYAGATPGTFDRDLTVTGRIAVNNAATLPGFGLTTPTSLTMNGNIALDDSPLAIIGTAGSTINLNGNISGTGLLSDNPAGTAVININGNNTFSGGGEMQSATWQLGSDTALGTGMFKLVQGGALQPTLVAVGGPRTIANEFVSFSSSANYWQIAGNNPITFTGSINLSGSYTHNINNSALTTYAGVLHTGAFTKAGTGTLVLSGNNIHTGNVAVSAGAMRVAHPNALGSIQAPTIVASGAALEIDGNILSLEPVTINGAGLSNNGAIRSISGSNSFGPITAGSAALVTVDSGTLTVGNISSASGTQGLFKGGPGHLAARRYRLFALDVLEGTASVVPGRSTDKTSVVNTLVVTGGATLDLGDNDLVVDYTAPNPTPLTVIRGLIANGYNGGTWNGDGITSSEADAGNFALGYAESSDLFTTFPATFSGVQVDDSAVLVRFTRYGDANLDGLVNLSDFNRLAANFGSSGAGWYEGDFNYDGTVNLIDFNRLAANFGLSASPDGATPADWAALAAVVPEPAGASVAFALAAAPTLLLRARRRRLGFMSSRINER